MTNAVRILKAARAKIEQGFCQNSVAMDSGGDPLCDGRDPRATSWCAVGAMQAVYDYCDDWAQANRALYYSVPGGLMLSTYNNRSTKKEVLALFDKAIASLEPRNFAAEIMEKIKVSPVEELENAY